MTDVARHHSSRSYLIMAAAITLIVHVLMLVFVVRVVVPNWHAATTTPANPSRNYKPISLKTIDIRDRVFQRPTLSTEQAERIQFQSALAGKKIGELFEKEKLLAKVEPEVKLSGLGQNILAPKLPVPPPAAPVAPEPPKIIEIDARTLPSERLTAERTRTAQRERRDLVGDKIPGLITGDGSGSGQGGRGDSISVSMRLTPPTDTPLRLSDLPPDDQERRQLRDSLTPAGGSPATVTLAGQSGAGRLDDLVTVALTVFDHPDGNRYFQIDIAPNTKSDKLRAIAKDVLFVIDCSTSIMPSKLDQFKDGVAASLQYLNATDRFNVVSFRTAPDAFFPRPEPVTEDALKSALGYVRRLERGGLTDVYAGIAPYVTATPDQANRPLNVFLLTDGKSTVSNRMENDAFIRQVARLRQAHVSIYSFSAGTEANRFLMDLLAYSNRGSSLHAADLKLFAPNLARFISDHSDMIVADLRYVATGDNAREFYPKQLPHLYRNETLHLYGRCPDGTEQVGIQLLGRDAQGREQELVFNANLKQAPRGKPGIAENWASQKIFHLLMARALTPVPAGSPQPPNREIRDLAEQFKLFVPY